jgi:hypothetical protein
MSSYISTAKDQVASIVADVKKTFLNESQVRIAVVGYKDHQDTPNVQFLDFTTSTDDVSRFLGSLTATGGGDIPEDVLGGVRQALNASWKQQTRCIVHIADAPPHGRDLHDLSEDQDNYYETKSEPHHLTYGPLIGQLIQLSINYALLSIHRNTDKMALAFGSIFGSRNAKLLTTNRYCGRLNPDEAYNSDAWMDAKRSFTNVVEPKFEELRLGTAYSQLRHLVVKTVTASVSRSAGRLSMALSKGFTTPGMKSPGMKSPVDLTVIREDGDSTAGLDILGELETAPPQWDVPGWLDETLEVGGFSPAIVVHNASTLNDMMASDDNIKLTVVDITIRARSRSFACGAQRSARYARTVASSDRFVTKSFLESGHGRPEVVEDMRVQALCKAFALEFNGLVKVEPPLDFVVTSCLQDKLKRKDCFSLEPYLQGDYVKYNSNFGYVNETLIDDTFNQMAQAFSHFTFERSWGLLLVNDLQGVGHLFTDPSIQTKDPERFKLSDTNLHEESFKCFFALHECNSICSDLGLKSTREMMASGNFEFRERWPTMDPTVCCSNKFCRSIIRLASAHQSTKFPSHHWCDSCWPQLESSTTRWVCVEPGPNHEYDVSKFFYESQGQLTPRKCPSHMEKDTKGSSTAEVGGRLWNRMKSPDSKGFIDGRAW